MHIHDEYVGPVICDLEGIMRTKMRIIFYSHIGNRIYTETLQAVDRSIGTSLHIPVYAFIRELRRNI